MNFIEIHQLADKKKWATRFMKQYKGEINPNAYAYGTNSRYILAIENGKELGFVRINDKSYRFQMFTSVPVWNITDAYVKPAYRHNGVLKALIQHVIENYNVRMIYMTTDRFINNLDYYRSLGFTFYYAVKETEMMWAFQTDFKAIASKFT